MCEQEEVITYFNRITKISDVLGWERDDQWFKSVFVWGLSPDLQCDVKVKFVETDYGTDDTVKFEQLLAVAKSAEKKRKKAVVKGKKLALQTQQKGSPEFKCGICGYPHDSKECYANPDNPKYKKDYAEKVKRQKHLKCKKCFRPGHDVPNCKLPPLAVSQNTPKAVNIISVVDSDDPQFDLMEQGVINSDSKYLDCVNEVSASVATDEMRLMEEALHEFPLKYLYDRQQNKKVVKVNMVEEAIQTLLRDESD